jgi:hypothetical protein
MPWFAELGRTDHGTLIDLIQYDMRPPTAPDAPGTASRSVTILDIVYGMIRLPTERRRRQ